MGAFISYQQKTGEIYAERIYRFFAENGIPCFWDKNNLYHYSGVFSEALQRGIEEAEDFILVLSGNCLERIEGPEHTVFRQEIERALARKKNIIPILCGGFRFPGQLYEGVGPIQAYEAIEITDTRYLSSSFFADLLVKMTPTAETERAYRRLTACTKLESRESVEDRYSLSERLGGAVEEVAVCAMACQALLSHAREHIDRLAENGCRIRVVMNDPASPAAQEAYQYKIAGGSLRHRGRIIPNTYDDLLDWMERYPAQIEGRLTDLYLPCAIFLIRAKDPRESTIKVDYYSFHCQDKNRRCVYIHADDEENFCFYQRQFEWIWEHARPIAGEEENSL